MGELMLIRHGQASFLTDDYDRLSDLGKEQSRRLGRHWLARGVAPTRVYTGPHLRHRQTLEEVCEVFAATGAPLPEAAELPGLAEFPWDRLMAEALSLSGEQDREAAALAAAYGAAADDRSKRRTFQRLFERVCRLWAEGRVSGPGIVPWAQFAEEIGAAVAEMTAESPRGARVAAFTSGGPVAVACLHALEIAPHKALELIHTLRNGAVTTFLFSEDRFSLGAFNDVAHLPTPELLTYR